MIILQRVLFLKSLTPDPIVEFIDGIQTPASLFSRIKYPLCDLKASESESPFFIIGSGRSGNTLLRRILSHHSDLVIPPEMEMLGTIIRVYCKSAHLSWERIVPRILELFIESGKIAESAGLNFFIPPVLPSSNLFGIDYSEILRISLALPEHQRSLAKIIDLCYRSYIDRFFKGKTRWGDKTPWNVFHLDRIHKVFPHASYIHIIRDGRDVVSSYHLSLNVDVQEAALRWLYSVRASRRFGAKAKQRYFEIRYEDLVRRPKQVIQDTCRFLGVEYQSEMLECQQEIYLGDTYLKHHANVLKPIMTDSVGAWKSRLSARDQKKIMPIIKPLLDQLRYF
jgi:protein-tyrosine sulfotransferase